jgi:hypothetical protein
MCIYIHTFHSAYVTIRGTMKTSNKETTYKLYKIISVVSFRYGCKTLTLIKLQDMGIKTRQIKFWSHLQDIHYTKTKQNKRNLLLTEAIELSVHHLLCKIKWRSTLRTFSGNITHYVVDISIFSTLLLGGGGGGNLPSKMTHIQLQLATSVITAFSLTPNLTLLTLISEF